MTILNPAPVAFDYTDLWPLVDIGIANEVETRVVGGDLDEEAAAKALLRAGSRVHHCNVGVEGRLRACVPTYIAAPSVEALDTSGAGDVLCGVLAAALTLRLDTADALRWAVAAARSPRAPSLKGYAERRPRSEALESYASCPGETRLESSAGLSRHHPEHPYD